MNNFKLNCKLYGIPESEMAETYVYKTPGLKEYTCDIKNYMSYMKPIIEQGLRKHIEAENKKKIITRESLNIIEEESQITNTTSSSTDFYG